MCDEHDGISTLTTMREKKMVAGISRGTRHQLSFKPQRGKLCCGLSRDFIHTRRIGGEAVDGDETAQEIERSREMFFGGGLKKRNVHRGTAPIPGRFGMMRLPVAS